MLRFVIEDLSVLWDAASMSLGDLDIFGDKFVSGRLMWRKRERGGRRERERGRERESQYLVTCLGYKAVDEWRSKFESGRGSRVWVDRVFRECLIY